MGASFTQCSNVVLGKPGDHTAGIMYNSWVSPHSPILGHSNFTNYPYGENLWQPLSVSSIVPSAAHWFLAHLTNIVCGWNILVFIGYMSNALLMYGLVYWLTKNAWASLFAAYAATFIPYHLFASTGQIAGLLGSLFILTLWLFLDLWHRPRLLKAIILGIVFGIGFYTDGYFILIGLVMLGALWLSAISYAALIPKHSFGAYKTQIISLAVTTSVALLHLLPLVWINHHYASQINSIFSSARGNIQQDAQIYSASLPMYVSPHSLLFVGWTTILLAGFGVRYLWQDYRKQLNKSPQAHMWSFTGWTALLLTILSTWMSLRPRFNFLGITLYNPSSLVIAVTSSWRVFGRLGALVVVGLCVLAGMGLARLLLNHTRYKVIIFLGSAFLLLLEFTIASPTSSQTTFDYRRAPAVYQRLKNNPKVNALAEYPLNEPPQGSFLGDYYTFQQISDKPILNTLRPNSPQAGLRRSIAGINDAQTLPVLRRLGINAINVRPLDTSGESVDLRAAAKNNPNLELLVSDITAGIDSYIIKPGPVANYALTIPSIQYFQIVIDSSGQAKYLVDDDTVLSIVKLPGTRSDAQKVTASFNIISDTIRQISVIQNGEVLWTGTIGTTLQNVQIHANPDYPISILNQKSAAPTHITLSKLYVAQ